MKLFRATPWWDLNWPVRFLAVPTFTIGAAILVREALSNVVADTPFLLLLVPITASAFVGGLLAGIITTALAVATVISLEPAYGLTALQASTSIRLLLFVIEAVVISGLCGALRNARLRAEVSAEQARDLQRQVSDAADREQNRIGQDLHDDLGQYLTAVALSGGMLARRVEKHDPALGAAAHDLVHMMNDAVNRTRQLARGMAPMTIEPDSLVLLLRELQERTSEMSGLDIHFEVQGPPPLLPKETVLHLYRIAQEAVGNASKHSKGKRIDILLRQSEDGITLKISDNGKWVQRATAGASMGLRVMQFRAQTIGAVLNIGPDPASTGTQVYCTIPAAQGSHHPFGGSGGGGVSNAGGAPSVIKLAPDSSG